jgi:Fe-Mn family superoxide dismutase
MGAGLVGGALAPSVLGADQKRDEDQRKGDRKMAFTLPDLPYDFNALEPHIDEQTMRIHHGKHHNAYVSNLNAALEKHPDLQSKDLEELLRGIDSVPQDIRQAVINNGGGHSNHSIFWVTMAPKDQGGGGEPAGELANAIKSTFGDFAKFKSTMSESGMKRFGSGWAWLVLDKSGKLAIESFPNQDSPYMKGLYPIVGVDVWEHAYYLKYQNRRADYLEAWWNVVNWKAAGDRFAKAKGA